MTLTGVARRFDRGDLDDLKCCPEVQEIFQHALDLQPDLSFAAIVTLPYGAVAWQDRRPQIAWPPDPALANFGDAQCAPVAMVTKGIMEVYETVKTIVHDNNRNRKSGPRGPTERHRRKTTVVGGPGTWFGLFEAYADWPGDWIISSGVVSFLVCNPIGNASRWPGRMPAEHFKIDRTSDLVFDALVPDSRRSLWTSESVWLKPCLIRDPAIRQQLENFLLRQTTHQLMSVLRQSPTWGPIGATELPSPHSMWMQYLDSVIDGNTPILQLSDLVDETHLPVRTVVETLSAYDRDDVSDGPGKTRDVHSSWDILIPRPLVSGRQGIHFVDHVSRYPPGGESCILGFGRDTIRHLGRDGGRTVELEGAVSTSFVTVKYGPDGYVSTFDAINSRVHPMERLSTDGRRRPYTWPKHFNRAVIISKV